MVILSSYEDMQRVSLAQRQLKGGRLSLVVFEAAHIVRAGGYREAGVGNALVDAQQRLFLSARRLTGQAPGALLAPGQDPGYPKEREASAFGPEVYRLTHEDAQRRNLSVPLRLSFLSSSNATDVARELARLHRRLGVRTFEIVPPRPRLARVVDRLLQNLTAGACAACTATAKRPRAVDALVVAGSRPDYVAVAQEFPRLARWEPGKRYGYILMAAVARGHAVAAWRALAIEDEAAEEAIQRSAVEAGRRDRRLRWEELPRELRGLVYEGTPRGLVETAVSRGVEGLGDPWDFWLGRLMAFKDNNGHASPGYFQNAFGHRLGEWAVEQRELWERKLLSKRKAARLRALGFILDLDDEHFAQGLAELRKFVLFKRTRVVPYGHRTESGFMLGEWVVEQRRLQRRGKLPPRRMELLREAFFLWQPSETPSLLFNHPEDPGAAEITRGVEEELRRLRWKPITERRRHFRGLVLRHHPDVSQDEHARTTIQFLADVKDWFLAGS